MKARGIETNMHELEKGIPAACKAHGIKPEDLGVKGCLLIYRRREQDMPLAQPPDNATPEQIAKTETGAAEDAQAGARPLSIPVSGAQAAARIRRREWAVVGPASRRNESRGTQGRADSRIGNRDTHFVRGLLNRLGARKNPRRQHEGRILHVRRREFAALRGKPSMSSAWETSSPARATSACRWCTAKR